MKDIYWFIWQKNSFWTPVLLFVCFILSPSVTEHWGYSHNTYSPYWERDLINLYSFTSFQHIFMQYDVNIFSCENVGVILLPSVVWNCFNASIRGHVWTSLVSFPACKVTSSFSWLHLFSRCKHLQCQISSFWNIPQRISETRTSTGSVWVTPRRESRSTWLLITANLTKEKKHIYFHPQRLF